MSLQLERKEKERQKNGKRKAKKRQKKGDLDKKTFVPPGLVSVKNIPLSKPVPASLKAAILISY